MSKKIMQVRRGEIYYAELSGAIGSEQNGARPVLIVQNDVGNRNSPTTIIAPLTSKKGKASLPTHISLDIKGCLPDESVILLEQVRTIDKSRLYDYVGAIAPETVAKVDEAIRISFGIGGEF